MNNEGLPYLSASELGRLIEKKEVSPVEATQAYLDRIDSLDFKYNAYITVCRREALEAARKAEEAIARGNYLGPMHGIPVAVKDQIWTKGIRTTAGSRILADFIPDEDATVIANLKVAGAVVLGKTNLTEFAIGGRSEVYRTARNPWNLDMYTGGSSTGSGTGTAAFLCATSLGEDTGGSIRQPAARCGLVGLRPSWGRVSRYGVTRGVWSMDAVGPISRTVEDAAMTLGAIAGHDPKDQYTWDTPVPDYLKALDGNIQGVRVGVIKEQIHTDNVDEEVKDAVLMAASVLGELGAVVEEVSLPLTRHAQIASGLLLIVESAATHRSRIRDQSQDYGHETRVRLLTGSLVPSQAYYKAQKLRSLLRQQVREALNKYDVLVLPTVGKPAEMMQNHSPVIRNRSSALPAPYILTRLFNLSSSPAITLPCGFWAHGLPIALQIGGRPGGDATVLKVAHAYEQNTSWHTMRPPGV